MLVPSRNRSGSSVSPGAVLAAVLDAHVLELMRIIRHRSEPGGSRRVVLEVGGVEESASPSERPRKIYRSRGQHGVSTPGACPQTGPLFGDRDWRSCHLDHFGAGVRSSGPVSHVAPPAERCGPICRYLRRDSYTEYSPAPSSSLTRKASPHSLLYKSGCRNRPHASPGLTNSAHRAQESGSSGSYPVGTATKTRVPHAARGPP